MKSDRKQTLVCTPSFRQVRLYNTPFYLFLYLYGAPIELIRLICGYRIFMVFILSIEFEIRASENKSWWILRNWSNWNYSDRVEIYSQEALATWEASCRFHIMFIRVFEPKAIPTNLVFHFYLWILAGLYREWANVKHKKWTWYLFIIQSINHTHLNGFCRCFRLQQFCAIFWAFFLFFCLSCCSFCTSRSSYVFLKLIVCSIRFHRSTNTVLNIFTLYN